MSKHLPVGGFKWLDPAKFNLDKYDADNLRGCVLEFDLEYPKRLQKSRSSHPEAFLTFNFIENTLRHWCSPVNLLHIFRTPLPKNTSGRLLPQIIQYYPLAPDKLEIKR